MRLYCIRRKLDGKFFVSAQGHYSVASGREQHHFATKPSQFLRTPDGVAGNLRKLCSTPYWSNEAPEGVHPAIAKGWKELAWTNFDPLKLELYEVVITSVSIFKAETVSADRFIQVESIMNAPLTARERRSGK